MSRAPRLPRSHGFTLLEVMVALAIFAVLSSAVLSASQYVLNQARVIEERQLAAWVADNYLNEWHLRSRSGREPAPLKVTMDRREWVVQPHVQQSRDQDLFEIDVAVSVDGHEPMYHASSWISTRDE